MISSVTESESDKKIKMSLSNRKREFENYRYLVELFRRLEQIRLSSLLEKPLASKN